MQFRNERKHATLYTDEYCLTQALINLLDNAIKYTRKGSVTLRLYETELGVFLDIVDTGIGISEEYMTELFTPYSQEDFGYSRAYEGIGLGLALVRQYLSLLNIPIGVQSEKNVGTTFTLNFSKLINPAQMPQNVIADSVKKHLPTRNAFHKVGEDEGKSNVLIVEDDEQTQDYLNLILTPKFEVFLAESAEQAQVILKAAHVDLILMDISPQGKKNGLELTKEIRTMAEHAHTPIIAVTAHAFPEDKKRSLDAGCSEYIAKPMSQTKLFHMIDQFLQRK